MVNSCFTSFTGLIILFIFNSSFASCPVVGSSITLKSYSDSSSFDDGLICLKNEGEYNLRYTPEIMPDLSNSLILDFSSLDDFSVGSSCIFLIDKVVEDVLINNVTVISQGVECPAGYPDDNKSFYNPFISSDDCWNNDISESFHFSNNMEELKNSLNYSINNFRSDVEYWTSSETSIFWTNILTSIGGHQGVREVVKTGGEYVTAPYSKNGGLTYNFIGYYSDFLVKTSSFSVNEDLINYFFNLFYSIRAVIVSQEFIITVPETVHTINLTCTNKNKNMTLAASAIIVKSNDIARTIITIPEHKVATTGVRYFLCSLLNTGGRS